jgi:hypothetical protein
LNKKAEAHAAKNLFYVFVRLNALDEPSFHIVPRAVVARTVRDSHRAWLDAPGRGGRVHVDSNVRKFKDLDDEYLDRWELLGLGVTV